MTTAAQPSTFTYSYIEPHPSVPLSNKVSTGRGGAGNATTLNPQKTTHGATATGPASRSPVIIATIPAPPRRVGRGGAGNVKSSVSSGKQPAVANVFELEREERHDHFDSLENQRRIQTYGRGGQGNVLNKERKTSDASSNSSVASRRSSVISSVSALSDRGGERKTSRNGSFADKMADKVAAKLRRSSEGRA